MYQVVTAAHCLPGADVNSTSVNAQFDFLFMEFMEISLSRWDINFYPSFWKFFCLILCHRLSLVSTPLTRTTMFLMMMTTTKSG